MDKVKTCNFGDKVTMALKFQNIQFKKTPSSADYASIIGFDTEDLIEVKIWSLPPEKKAILNNGDVYICSGTVKEYQGKKQLNISDFRLANENEVNFEEFYEYAPLTKKELQTKISTYISKITNETIKNIVLTAVKKHVNEFFEYPAAVTIHHNYISGLAYHTYSMLVLSEPYLNLYPYFNKDLVYAGIILHDIGKVKELSGSRSTTYTKEGNLLGHITMGTMILRDICTELKCEDTEEALCLEHIILSHHGELEYGSPKEPMIPEAALIFLLDYSDSRFACLLKNIENKDESDYTEPVFAFDKRTFYIPKLKK